MLLCAPIIWFIVILFSVPMLHFLRADTWPKMLSCVLCCVLLAAFPVVPMASQPVSACPQLECCPRELTALLPLPLCWCIVAVSYRLRRLAVVAYFDGMDGIVPALDKASAVLPHGR
jgi:hypothetical protein